jgi:hypothetical protein
MFLRTGPPPPPPSRRRPSRRSETSCADTPTSSTSLRPPGCSDDAAACLALSPRPSLSLSLSLEKGISLPPSPSRSRSEYLSLRGAVSAHAGADRRAVGVPRQHLPDRRPGLSRLTRRACRRRGRGGTPSQAQHATHNQQKQRAPPPLHLQPASPRAPRVCLADVFIALPPPQTGLETLTLYIWDEDFKEWALPNSLEEVRLVSPLVSPLPSAPSLPSPLLSPFPSLCPFYLSLSFPLSLKPPANQSISSSAAVSELTDRCLSVPLFACLPAGRV